MPFVERDSKHQIVAVYRHAGTNAEEELPFDSAELMAFMQGDASEAQSAFSILDADLVRVIEDVVDLLIKKGVLLPTDLPAAVQDKLSQRRQVRERIGEGSFMVDSKDII